MKIKKIIVPTLFAFATFSLHAQDLTEANELYKEGNYAGAVPFYEEVVKTRPSAAVKSKLANCYRIIGKNTQAAELYSDITRDDIALPVDIQHYGEVFISLGKFDSAKVYLKKYGELFPDDQQNQKLLSVCDNAKNVKTFGIESNISVFSYNSKVDERIIGFIRNGILFASDRPSGGFGKTKSKSKSKDEDYGFWYAARKDSDFEEPVRYSKKLDGITENGGNASFTADMKNVYYSRIGKEANKRGKYKFQLYSATSEDGERWRNDIPLSFCSPDEEYLNPSVSPDGKRLYFAAERADAMGETDIYYVEKNDEGEWSKPKSLGKTINTELEENFPTAGADGKLYFCSKGHNGFGGYDIFVTEQDANGDWKTPANLGTPINSPYDDFSIIFSDEKHGAFNSARAGKNHDLYFFEITKLNQEEKAQDITPSVVETKKKEEDKKAKEDEIIVASTKKDVEKKIVADAEKKNNNPVGEETKTETKPEVKEPAKEEVKNTQAEVKEEPKTSSPEVKEEKKVAKTDDDDDDDDDKNTDGDEPEVKREKSFIDEMSKLLAMNRLKKNKKIMAPSLEFKNMYEIEFTPEVESELKRFAEFLNHNKKLEIEIGAYTEMQGDSKKLKQIAQRRADKIVEYLIEQGVKEKRLTAKGYGARKPLKDCSQGGCNEGDDDKNRRIEVKVKAY